jgi:hypothetical protein
VTVTPEGRGAGSGAGGDAGGWAWPPLDVTGWASADALTARPIKAAHFLRLRTNFPLKAKRRDLLAQAPHGQR